MKKLVTILYMNGATDFLLRIIKIVDGTNISEENLLINLDGTTVFQENWVDSCVAQCGQCLQKLLCYTRGRGFSRVVPVVGKVGRVCLFGLVSFSIISIRRPT